MTVDILQLTDEEFLKKFENLVHYVLNKFKGSLSSIKHNTNLEYDDLYQLGVIGLLKARKNFDPSRGFQFSTYAIPMIAGEIHRALRDSNKIKGSRHIIDLKNKIIKDNLDDLPPNEIAVLLDVPEKTVKAAIDYRPSYDYINRTAYQRNYGDDDITLEEMLVDKYSENLDDFVIGQKVLDAFFNTLEEKERLVWYLYNKHHVSQAEIGKLIGVNQASVSRILKRIEDKAREYGKRCGHIEGGI